MIAAKTVSTIAILCASLIPPSKITNSPSAPNASKQEMLDEVNQLRSKGCHCGRKYMQPVKPIAWNPRLEKAALAHASDMQRNDFFSHKGSNGSNIGDRADKAGYQWKFVGENIAFGYASFGETLDAWITSPGHCRNLMNANYTEMAVAKVGETWVQDFGNQMGRN